jgi:hypothetical protein
MMALLFAGLVLGGLSTPKVRAQGETTEEAAKKSHEEALKLLKDHPELMAAVRRLGSPPPTFTRIRLKNQSNRMVRVRLVGYLSYGLGGYVTIDATQNMFPQNAALELPAASDPTSPVIIDYVFEPGVVGMAHVKAYATFEGFTPTRVVEINTSGYQVLPLPDPAKLGGFKDDHSGDPPLVLLTGNGSAGSPYRVRITSHETWDEHAPAVGNGPVHEDRADQDPN